MYKAIGKGNIVKRMVDISDLYLCSVYDGLWGDQIYRMITRNRRKKHKMTWHEKVAFHLADYLPPSIMSIKLNIKMLLSGPMRRRIKRLEKKLFGKEL